MTISKLSEIEEINEKIKLYKEKLDFLDKLEKMIQNGITGFELIYELEEYKNYIDKKMSEIKETYDIHLNTELKVEVHNILIKIRYIDDLKETGKNKVLNYEIKSRPILIGNEILNDLKKIRSNTLNEIGYLEFLKQKPKSKVLKEIIDNKEDLEDWINFLDDKYKEWEKTKSGKKT